MQNLFEQFRQEMMAKGITPPPIIIPNGEFQRFSTNGKVRDAAGWYIFYYEGIASGAFGDWRASLSYAWCSKTQEQMTQNEWDEHKKRIAETRRIADLEKAKMQAMAVRRARFIWKSAKPADPTHPYLRKKRIRPFLTRQKNNSLVLPIIGFDNHITSLQFIEPDGGKKLLYGGEKKGKFIQVHGVRSGSRMLICEGFATAATLAQGYPDSCVIAAIDAGNLKAVAVQARQSYPDAEIVICADDDRLTIGNPGITKGREAAKAANALLTSPEWPPNAPEDLTDFNDLACWLSDRSMEAL